MQELYRTSAGRLAWFTPGQEPKGAVKANAKAKAKQEKKSETVTGTDDVLAKARQVKNKSAK